MSTRKSTSGGAGKGKSTAKASVKAPSMASAEAPAKSKPTKVAAKSKPAAAGKRGERAIFARLPSTIREAFSVAAQEVFFENIEQAVEDPQGLLDEGNLGSTLQGFHRGITSPAELAEALVSLSPWTTPELLRDVFKRASPAITVGSFAGDLYDVLLFAAAIDIAEGIVRRALGQEQPPRLVPLA